MINILDKETIDKIAAGEVVERPESVVKELIENSIDSLATIINVEIKDGGVSLIRVSDNGQGIEKSDVRKAFIRHATSKLKDASDLFHIFTMGFRGEALASIAGVSETELITRVESSLVGTRYIIHGGKEISIEDIGAPLGTTILVKNLFYNIPVRRKFLRTFSTEANYVNDVVEKIALSRPDICFSFTSDGKTKLRTNGSGNLLDVIYTIYGKQTASELIKVEHDEQGIRVSGYIGKPVISRAKRDSEIFYVNNRFINSDVIRNAVEEAFSSYLMQHRFPFAILKIDVDPSLVDVNIHPRKTEIKFTDQSLVYSVVKNSVLSAVSKKELIVEPARFIKDNQINNSVNCLSQDLKKSDSFEYPAYNTVENSLDMVQEKKNPEMDKVILPFEKKRQYEYVGDIMKSAFRQAETLSNDDIHFLKKENQPEYKIIGQVFETYWIIEFEDQMYIIDQHAAHEKVNYERFINDIESHSVLSQQVYPPIMITLASKEAGLLNERLDVLNSIGYEIENIEGNDFYIRAVPSNVPEVGEKELFMDLIDGLSELKDNVSSDVLKAKIASMSCKAAVKGNMTLSLPEIKALISELLMLKDPYNCPHGRPTIIKFSKTDLEKMFKRIV